ncbi:serine hydrolase [Actinacidiphila sp. bgisy145]|uniref:serine hydrolase n=1 Tax=Actinacidiphila sp. bgisy145 TaxID=3413792 RepID=UPI003EBE1D69
MEQRRPLADREGGGWAAMAGTHGDGTGAAPVPPRAEEDAGAPEPATRLVAPGAIPAAAATGSAPAHAAARSWTRPLLISVTALAAMAVLTLATIVQSPSAKAGSDINTNTTTDTATPKAGASPSSPSASASTTTSPTDVSATDAGTADTAATTTASTQAAVTSAVRALGVSGNVSVAVTDAGSTAGTSSAATYATGATSYDTASIVKVDILATLLLQHQKTGTQLTASQKALATKMIEESDNSAALELWRTIGRKAGLATANASFGLTHTVGGDNDLWGLTQTTAGDQIALLHAVFDSGSPLSSTSRAYIAGLMRSVVAGERWGVSAADTDSSGYALKNGWLQRSATGLWDINSIGEVTYDGHRLLVSVLSSGQRTEQGAIDQVEQVAQAAAKAYVASAA